MLATTMKSTEIWLDISARQIWCRPRQLQRTQQLQGADEETNYCHLKRERRTILSAVFIFADTICEQLVFDELHAAFLQQFVRSTSRSGTLRRNGNAPRVSAA